MVGSFKHTLTQEEHTELDDWVTASDENMHAFEDCLEIAQRSFRPNPDVMDEEENDIR